MNYFRMKKFSLYSIKLVRANMSRFMPCLVSDILLNKLRLKIELNIKFKKHLFLA